MKRWFHLPPLRPATPQRCARAFACKDQNLTRLSDLIVGPPKDYQPHAVQDPKPQFGSLHPDRKTREWPPNGAELWAKALVPPVSKGTRKLACSSAPRAPEVGKAEKDHTDRLDL